MINSFYEHGSNHHHAITFVGMSISGTPDIQTETCPVTGKETTRQFSPAALAEKWAKDHKKKAE